MEKRCVDERGADERIAKEMEGTVDDWWKRGGWEGVVRGAREGEVSSCTAKSSQSLMVE